MSTSKTLVRIGTFTLIAGGIYAIWRNRFKIQRTLEANGISTRWMNTNLGEAVQSGAAMVAGKAEGAVSGLQTSLNKMSSTAGKAETKLNTVAH